VHLRIAGVGCAFAAALSAATPSAAIPALPVTTASLSPATAGAKRVELTVKVHYEMICGQPGRGTAVVTLPAASAVPSTIAAPAVLVNGKQPPSVSVSGHVVTITMPPQRQGVTCMVVGPGTLTLTLTRAAGLANPTSPGTYTIRVRRGTRSFQARVHVSA
jgi:hypothetical protein